MLKRSGLKSYRQVRCPRITPRQVATRRAFASQTLARLGRRRVAVLGKQPVLDLHTIVFSDEKSFRVTCGTANRHNARVWVDSMYSTKAEVPVANLVLPDEHFTRKVMVSGACSWLGGLHPPHFVEAGCKINSEQYIMILANHLIPSSTMHYGTTAGFILQQDGAPSHRSAATMEWIRAHRVRLLDWRHWPPNSPDLQVLDFSLWATWQSRVEALVRSEPTALDSDETFRGIVLRAARQVTLQEVRNAIAAFPKRLELCLQAEGGHFQWRA
eukprot:6476402-Amphidinium_carterae.1